MHDAHDRQQTHDEQHDTQREAPYVRYLRSLTEVHLYAALRTKHYSQYEKHKARPRYGQHSRKEIPGRHGVFRVYV